MTSVDIVQDVRLLSSTKDSIHIVWNVDNDYSPHIQGYKVEYQAEGSHIIQHAKPLTPDITDLEVIQLHENTYYRFCVDVVTNLTSEVEQKCVRATTSVDSLHVALGSTFGAFLALGIIVCFVFLAKWQHTRKLRKLALHNIASGGDTYDSIMPEGEIEMSDVSLQVHDGTNMTQMEVSSHSSDFSGKSSSSRRQSKRHLENGNIAKGEVGSRQQSFQDDPEEGAVGGEEEDIDGSSGAVGGAPEVKVDMNHRPSLIDSQPPPPIEPPPPSLKKRSSRDTMNKDNNSTSSNNTNPHQSTSPSPAISPLPDNTTDPSPPPGNSNSQRKDYGGARPKEFSSADPRSVYAATPKLIDFPETAVQPAPLKSNASCNW